MAEDALSKERKQTLVGQLQTDIDRLALYAQQSRDQSAAEARQLSRLQEEGDDSADTELALVDLRAEGQAYEDLCDNCSRSTRIVEKLAKVTIRVGDQVAMEDSTNEVGVPEAVLDRVSSVDVVVGNQFAEKGSTNRVGILR
jgi:hypothetical protein